MTITVRNAKDRKETDHVSKPVKGPGATRACPGAMPRGGECRSAGHKQAGAGVIVALLLTLSGAAFTG